MRHCINCTNKMPEDVPICDECGHDMAADAALVSADASVPEGTSADAEALADDHPTARNNASNVTVLCYDERMTEHEEGKPNPHPERPDRIRAVMARLKRQGLLGTWPHSIYKCVFRQQRLHTIACIQHRACGATPLP